VKLISLLFIKYPYLAEIAIRIFSIPTSSAASERAWSTFSFIHNKKRNRLANDKVNKLAFVYINASLIDEQDKRDYAFQQMQEDESLLTLNATTNIINNIFFKLF
jgi:hypothetical protein